MIKPPHTREEVAALGEVAFEHSVSARVRGQDVRHFVALDVDSGEYEVDADAGLAIRRLLDRKPGAQFWLRRVGSRVAHSFGPRMQFEPPRSA